MLSISCKNTLTDWFFFMENIRLQIEQTLRRTKRKTNLTLIKMIRWQSQRGTLEKAPLELCVWGVSYLNLWTTLINELISSVIRQTGESLNGCFKKTSMQNFPKNEHFLPLTRTSTYFTSFWCFIVNFKHISHLFLVFLLLTLKK